MAPATAQRKREGKTFVYKVRDASGKVASGTMEGPTQAAVAEKLRRNGFSPITISEQRTNPLQAELSIPGLGNTVGLKDLAVFSRQFATMINSGLSLIRTLNILAEQTENKRLAEVTKELRAYVEEGGSLSDAMAQHDDVFPKLHIAMVRAGETAGNLDEVLVRVAETLEKDLALRRKIKSAVTYPIVVLVLAILAVIAMLVFVVPTFVGMFEDMGGDLPVPTQILLAMSNFVQAFWWTFPIIAIVAWQAFRRSRRNASVRYRLDQLKLRLPVFGPLFRKVALSRFARNLSSLLKAGVPILQALDITAETVNNGVVSDALGEVRTSVKEGESVAGPLEHHEVFPPMTVQMLAVGEETGQIDLMLTKISEFYDQEVEAATESLTAMLEPLMIAVLGGIVGAMVIALYMPMFEIFDLIE